MSLPLTIWRHFPYLWGSFNSFFLLLFLSFFFISGLISLQFFSFLFFYFQVCPLGNWFRFSSHLVFPSFIMSCRVFSSLISFFCLSRSLSSPPSLTPALTHSLTLLYPLPSLLFSPSFSLSSSCFRSPPCVILPRLTECPCVLYHVTVLVRKNCRSFVFDS